MALDAPTIRQETLTPQQRAGKSCTWCSYWADPRFPVPLLRTAGLNLHACATCAGQYGIPPVEVDQ